MKRLLAPAILLLLALLAVACFELRTENIDTGVSREARLNPWLAAGRLLEREGVAVRFAPEYGGLPAHARVIVLATSLDYLDEDDQVALLQWVRQGGHLVSELNEVADDPREAPRERVAEAVDVRLLEHDFEGRERGTRVRDRDGLRALQLDDEGSIQAGFTPQYHMVPGKLAPAWRAQDRYGFHALRFRVGAGRLTLLSDTGWMENLRLGRGDHAALLWRVVDARAHDEVWLIPGIERPSLARMAWEKGSAFLVSLGLFVLAWLWSASRRFGPLAPVSAPARRRLGEHLEACGRYLMRHGGLAGLHDASRQRLLATVHRRHPQWRRLGTPELAQRLAERARIEPAAVQRLLQRDAPDQLLPFAADIRLINRLRKAL